MKMMVSQPMMGKSVSQIENERQYLVEQLEADGYEVINTVIEENAPSDCNPGLWYLAKSIEFMSKVDGVIFMDGWEKSRGCVIEEMCAKAYGKFLKYETR